MTGAECAGAHWHEAFVGNSVLEHADFTDTDLSWLRRIDCNCARTSFRGADFERANTVYSRFTGARFERARRFFRGREIVTEILSHEINGDLERAKLVGVVAMNQDWCYPEWAKILALQPHYRQVVTEIFRQNPNQASWKRCARRHSYNACCHHRFVSVARKSPVSIQRRCVDHPRPRRALRQLVAG